MEKTLVILAAGMGSRFGGLKQIEPVGPSGEIIADYSIYDAMMAGFKKVVFVIRKKNLDYFKEHIVAKYADKFKVEFAFQELDKIPSDVVIPKTREKMLGTAHALLCCKDLVDGDFVMINSDDFYGRSAYLKAMDFLNTNHDEMTYLTVNYPFYLASSKVGKVNRGVVVEKDNYVVDITECSLEYKDNAVLCQDKKTLETWTVSKDQPVALNFFAFKKSIFKILEEEFNKFIHGQIDDTCELLLTDVLKEKIKAKEIKMKTDLADSKWLGVTYKEDLKDFKEELNKMIKKGVYKDNLWK